MRRIVEIGKDDAFYKKAPFHDTLIGMYGEFKAGT